MSDNEVSKETNDVNTAKVDVNGPFPDELKRWNWAAFFLNWIWAVSFRAWIPGILMLVLQIISFQKSRIPSALSAIVSLAILILAIIFGLNGNKWAWQNVKVDSIEQFNKLQRRWATWAWILAIFPIVAMIALAVSFSYLLTGHLSPTSSTKQPASGSVLANAVDAHRKADIHAIQTDLKLYYTDFNKQAYPDTLKELVDNKVTLAIPVDPTTKQDYTYTVKSDHQDYSLCVTYSNDSTECFTKSTSPKPN